MKTSWLTIVLLVFAASRIQGQVSQSGSPASAGQGTIQAPDTPYAVVSKGANQQVWQKTTYETLPSGQTVPHIHQYTELATGLHYWKNGQWVDSKEEIDILPNGTAAATNGQHQVYFPGDIYEGVIELVTPDGVHLQSRSLGLSYDDGTNTVLIAELTNSVGYLVGSNQVIYRDAFTDFKADLRYTYTKAGFEQDIILREQPLTPESYGLNPTTARLQVLTEFFNPPQPAVTTMLLPKQVGIALSDENLDFGVMKMMPGRAFLLGSDAHAGGALVSKSWVKLEGRQFLVEEVPVEALAAELAQLPVPQTGSTKLNVNSMLHVVSAKRLLPSQRLVRTSPAKMPRMQMAQAAAPVHGLVLDYATVTSQTGYTFQGDTTYYISGAVYLYGTNTFEGGAVLKYATNASLSVEPCQFQPTLNWQASAYRPVIFTAVDDNSVGVSFGSGNPSGYYANPALQLIAVTSPPIDHFRVAYARQGVFVQANNNAAYFYNGQIINCQDGFIAFEGTRCCLRNILFSADQTNLDICFMDVDIQNSTFSSGTYLTAGSIGYQTLNPHFTNCLFINVSNLTNNPAVPYLTYQISGGYNGFYNCPNFGSSTVTNPFYPFQTVGGGGFYLTNGCNFFNQGTTNIDSTLLADIATKTTHPPIVYSNQTISTNLILGPQVSRDTNTTPDLGYHYDPLDYITDELIITNATLTVSNGVAIACYNRPGILLQDGSSMVSVGTPVSPNWFVRCQSVQEQYGFLGGTNISSGQNVSASPCGSVGPNGTFQFTRFACPAGGGIHLYDYAISSYSNLMVQDCEFWSGANTLGGTNGTVLTLRNNLFARSVINASGNGSLSLSNTLAWGVSSVQLNPSSTNTWYAFNNDFDSCSITNSTLTNGYNAYLNCSGRLYPTNAHDVVSNATLAYQTGFLGTFYQPTNSPLIDVGSTNANLVGLYQYTTQTNQVKEANSIVDIGYHYVAVDANGVPIDTNGDGIPDYLEDANGNGIYDAGDLGDWVISPFNGLTTMNGLVVFTPLR